MTKLTRNSLNLFIFQAIWWSHFLLIPRAHYLEAFLIFVALLSIHLFMNKSNIIQEFLFIAVVGGLGFLSDLILEKLGLFQIYHQNHYPWLLALWVGFACTWEHSLKGLLSKQVLLLFASFVFGPLSYWAGEQGGLLVYSEPKMVKLFYHGIFWVLFMFVIKKYMIEMIFVNKSRSN